MPVLYIFIMLVALGGFALSFYLWRKKRGHQALVCPIGADCRTVIHSEYSKFLGLPVERLGLLYYGAIIVVYVLLASSLNAQLSASLSLAALSASFGAFLFSIYLTFVQAFNLKQWCSWCLLSAALSTAIFFSGLFALDKSFVELLAQSRGALLIGTILAASAGAGTASVVGMLIFRFLRDFKISQFEADTLRVLSELVWVSLGSFLLVVLELYLAGPAPLVDLGYFIVVVLCAILLSAASLLLYLQLLPRVIKISFGEVHEHMAGELKLLRRAVIVLGWACLGLWYWVVAILVGPLISQL